MSRIIIVIGIVGVLIIGGWWLFSGSSPVPEIVQKTENTLPYQQPGPKAEPQLSRPTSPASPSAAPRTSAPSPTPTSVTGRTVFLLKDGAVSLDSMESIHMTVNEIAVKSSAKGWVTVASTPHDVDLLDLYHTSRLETMADVNLVEGVYDALRLKIGKITVVEKNSGGIAHDAKLPSGTMTFVGNLVVKKGKSSAVTLDVIAAKSLHTAGNGTFMFFPVVRASMQSEVSVQQSGKSIYVTSGKSDFDTTLGMDETGATRNGFSFGSGVKFDLLGNVIRVIPAGEKQSGSYVSAEAAIDAAMKSGYIDTTLSITTSVECGVAVWKVVGSKKLLPATLYIDVATGAVVGKE